jgi:hypothetical protein
VCEHRYAFECMCRYGCISVGGWVGGKVGAWVRGCM